MKPIRCIIVDDEKEARDRLAIQLSKLEGINIVGLEGDPEKAIGIIKDKHPDIAFLDVEMPKMSGFEIVKKVREEGISLSFIFVTGYNQYAIKALRNAAFDFLVKPVDIDELKEAINRFRMERPQQEIKPGSLEKLGLSNRESEVLSLMIKGKNSQHIADELFISKHTVDTHRRHILEKSGCRNTRELIIWALSRGLQ